MIKDIEDIIKNIEPKKVVKKLSIHEEFIKLEKEHPKFVVCEGHSKDGELLIKVGKIKSQFWYWFPNVISDERADELVKMAKKSMKK